jgi:hypothetical protein
VPSYLSNSDTPPFATFTQRGTRTSKFWLDRDEVLLG